MQVRPCGDTAFVVTLGSSPDPALSRRIAALRCALLAAQPVGLMDAVAGFVTLTVMYDPDVTSLETLAERVTGLAPDAARAPPPRQWTIPVCYDVDCAPDLRDVAAATGLSEPEIVHLHSSRLYTVYLLGFSPGFPYLGDLDDRLALPRRGEPRPRVPAGSVAIATRYTAIYPQETPGGWHLIGRTPLQLFAPAREEPALLQVGDTVRFDSITRNEYERLVAQVGAGAYTPCCQEAVTR